MRRATHRANSAAADRGAAPRTGLEIDARRGCAALERFIRRETRRAGMAGVVVGLSGGIDSALSAALAARALGPENVHALLMPYRTSSPDSRRDAEEVTRWLGIGSTLVDISPMIDAYFASWPDADRVRRGNKMARERMSILFDHSADRRALVLGTSNRTEILLGYGTLFGDTACSINAIGSLYKTQVRALARHVGVPEKILLKVPTADLWPGQTDEGELGYSYDELDRLLFLMVDRRQPAAALVRRGFSRAMVRDVAERVRRSEFKRRAPLIAPLWA
jgi:NAD+ synthase